MIYKRKKKEYYDQLSKKLNDLLSSPKAQWSILKPFYNGTKIPLIPPLIIDRKIVTNFREANGFFKMMFLLRNVHPL